MPPTTTLLNPPPARKQVDKVKEYMESAEHRVLFYGMKLCGTLRVPEKVELEGLDATHHGGPAYLDVDEAVVIKHEGSIFKRKKADTATAEA